MAIPTRTDSALVNWSTNFNTRIVAAATDYGLTAAQAAAYTAVHDPFITSYNAVVAAREAGVRSSPLVATKDQAKFELLRYGRELYSNVQASVTVSDARKIELGVHVKDVEPSPQPVPSFAPGLSVVSINGRLVKIRLFDPAHPERKRMPAGVNGAIVMSYVGPTAPSDPSLYKMEGPTSKTTVDVLFPETALPGTQVWLCAMFFNQRKQMGFACIPVGAVINYAGSMPMAA